MDESSSIVEDEASLSEYALDAPDAEDATPEEKALLASITDDSLREVLLRSLLRLSVGELVRVEVCSRMNESDSFGSTSLPELLKEGGFEEATLCRTSNGNGEQECKLPCTRTQCMKWGRGGVWGVSNVEESPVEWREACVNDAPARAMCSGRLNWHARGVHIWSECTKTMMR